MFFLICSILVGLEILLYIAYQAYDLIPEKTIVLAFLIAIYCMHKKIKNLEAQVQIANNTTYVSKLEEKIETKTQRIKYNEIRISKLEEKLNNLNKKDGE